MSLVDSLPIVHLGDVGTIFRVTVTEKVWNASTLCWDDSVVDISSATSMEILFLMPSGKTRIRPAVFTTDGTDGGVQYTSAEGDISEAGGRTSPWHYSAWIERPGKKHTTTEHPFRVEVGIPRPEILALSLVSVVALVAPETSVTIA